MKTQLFSALFLLTAAAGAQTDTTRVQIGSAKVIIVDEDSTDAEMDTSSTDLTSQLTHWGGLDLGVNLLLAPNGSTSMEEGSEWLELQYERSLSWRFNVIEQKIRLVDEYAGLVLGLGLTYNSYGFRNNVRVVSNTEAFSDTTFGVVDTLVEFSKTKLRATYLQVPLLLEFNTSKDPKRTFHVAAGVIGGWKIGSIAKQEYELDGASYQVRSRQDFNLTPWTLEATARIGYRNFTLFGTYGLTPLFRDGRGPEVYPVTLGLSVIPW